MKNKIIILGAFLIIAFLLQLTVPHNVAPLNSAIVAKSSRTTSSVPPARDTNADGSPMIRVSPTHTSPSPAENMTIPGELKSLPLQPGEVRGASVPEERVIDGAISTHELMSDYRGLAEWIQAGVTPALDKIKKCTAVPPPGLPPENITTPPYGAVVTIPGPPYTPAGVSAVVCDTAASGGAACSTSVQCIGGWIYPPPTYTATCRDNLFRLTYCQPYGACTAG